MSGPNGGLQRQGSRPQLLASSVKLVSAPPQPVDTKVLNGRRSSLQSQHGHLSFSNGITINLLDHGSPVKATPGSVPSAYSTTSMSPVGVRRTSNCSATIRPVNGSVAPSNSRPSVVSAGGNMVLINGLTGSGELANSPKNSPGLANGAGARKLSLQGTVGQVANARRASQGMQRRASQSMLVCDVTITDKGLTSTTEEVLIEDVLSPTARRLAGLEIPDMEQSKREKNSKKCCCVIL